MNEIHKPFDYIERPMDPPEPPTIPEGISGYYDARNDEFIADSDAFEAALEDWDLMPMDRREKFKDCLIELFFQDWKRIEAY